MTNPTEDHNQQARGAELLPCPFCAGTRITALEGSTYRWVLAECADCGARCGEVRAYDDYTFSNTALVAAWNTRAPSSRDAEVREVLEGLSQLRRYDHGQPERCWCDADDPETPHMPHCLATQALYDKLQPKET